MYAALMPAILLHFMPTALTIAIDITKPASLFQLQNITLPHPLLMRHNLECHMLTQTPPLVGLNPTNCEKAAEITCQRMASRPPASLVREKWIWIELPGCAIGYYLQEEQDIPNQHRCDLVLDNIVENCARNSSVNSGTNNVMLMPDFAQDGMPISVEDAMWVMAPERLTL